MPLREYACGKCGTRKERIEPLMGPAGQPTMTCCDSEMSRLPAAPAFHLRGGGWAKDGYENGTQRSKDTQ